MAGRNEILASLGAMAVELQRKLGEPRESVRKFNEPLDRATSSSLEALQLLAQGYRRHSARDRATTSYYQRAIELDPNFALAYVGLGTGYSNAGEMELAWKAEKKAYGLCGRLTGPTRFRLRRCTPTWALESWKKRTRSMSDGRRHFPSIQGLTLILLFPARTGRV